MPVPLGINTLIFDLDGTLTIQHPNSIDVFFTILDELEVPLLASAHQDTFRFVYHYWANSKEVIRDMKRFGELTPDFWLNYLKRKLMAAGIIEREAEALVPIVQPILKERDKPENVVLEDVIPSLKGLRGQGYQMGLVTNRFTSIEEEIERLGFSPYFDFYFTAGEVSSWKPAEGIFEHALYLSESTPKETAYIGDNYYTDVIGARQAGLYPILYDPRNIFPGADCQVISAISDLC